MILLLSVSNDYTTFEVMRWIEHLDNGAKMVRVNADQKNFVTDVSLFLGKGSIESRDHKYDLDEIDAVWYRKGKNYYTFSSKPDIKSNHVLNHELTKITNQDATRVNEYFHSLLEKRDYVLGAHERGNLNKLITLSEAKACGLKVPEFIVSNRKSDILSFMEKHGGCITKAISDGLYKFDYDITEKGYFNYTSELTEDKLACYEESMPLSFVQAMVAKKYEVRTFFLEGKCDSIAIFSQQDDQTMVDYRKYNSEKPNRTVPYKLPEDIRSKLVDLFAKLDLNTGSVDFIVDENNQFLFLEINPVGQFSTHSINCNYGLEKKVAEVLLNERS